MSSHIFYYTYLSFCNMNRQLLLGSGEFLGIFEMILHQSVEEPQQFLFVSDSERGWKEISFQPPIRDVKPDRTQGVG